MLRKDHTQVSHWQMTKKNKAFIWGGAKHKSFMTVKDHLNREPVFEIVDFDKEIYVQTWDSG